MRISTQQYYDTSAVKYQNNYSSVVKAQEQASSGVRVQTASDDPVAAQRLLMLQQQKDMLAQYSGNITSIQNTLTNEESVLEAINTTIQAGSQLALRAGGVTSDADRKSISVEVGALEISCWVCLTARMRRATICSPVPRPIRRRIRATMMVLIAIKATKTS